MIPFQPQEWVVFAGPATSASILHMEADTQVMIVKDILSQPGSRHLQHVTSRDLALISLHEPLSFSPSLGAACISREEVEGTEQQCVIVGWRKEANGKLNSDIINILLTTIYLRRHRVLIAQSRFKLQYQELQF